MKKRLIVLITTLFVISILQTLSATTNTKNSTVAVCIYRVVSKKAEGFIPGRVKIIEGPSNVGKTVDAKENKGTLSAVFNNLEPGQYVFGDAFIPKNTHYRTSVIVKPGEKKLEEIFEYVGRFHILTPYFKSKPIPQKDWENIKVSVKNIETDEVIFNSTLDNLKYTYILADTGLYTIKAKINGKEYPVYNNNKEDIFKIIDHPETDYIGDIYIAEPLKNNTKSNL